MNIHFKTLTWLTLAIALCTAPVFGCGDDSGDDDDAGGAGNGNSQAGKGGGDKDGGAGDDAKDGGGGKGGSKADGGGGGGKGGSKADAGGDVKDGGGSCEGDDGCYACADKTTEEQFLNQCTESQSEVFDNAERIEHELPNGKLWKPGDDLPEVP